MNSQNNNITDKVYDKGKNLEKWYTSLTNKTATIKGFSFNIFYVVVWTWFAFLALVRYRQSMGALTTYSILDGFFIILMSLVMWVAISFIRPFLMSLKETYLE